MRTKLSLAVGATGILAIIGLLGWTASAQAPASAPASLACDDDPLPDTNQTTDPPTATPINASLLTRGLPCAEKVSTRGLFGDDGLANLQGGFDFYSSGPQCSRRREPHRPSQAEHTDKMGAAQQFQTAARRDAAGWKSIQMGGEKDRPAGIRSIQQIERQGDGY